MANCDEPKLLSAAHTHGGCIRVSAYCLRWAAPLRALTESVAPGVVIVLCVSCPFIPAAHRTEYHHSQGAENAWKETTFQLYYRPKTYPAPFLVANDLIVCPHTCVSLPNFGNATASSATLASGNHLRY